MPPTRHVRECNHYGGSSRREIGKPGGKIRAANRPGGMRPIFAGEVLSANRSEKSDGTYPLRWDRRDFAHRPRSI